MTDLQILGLLMTVLVPLAYGHRYAAVHWPRMSAPVTATLPMVLVPLLGLLLLLQVIR